MIVEILKFYNVKVLPMGLQIKLNPSLLPKLLDCKKIRQAIKLKYIYFFLFLVTLLRILFEKVMVSSSSPTIIFVFSSIIFPLILEIEKPRFKTFSGLANSIFFDKF